MKTTNTSGRFGYLLDWMIPGLFALLVSATIRFHSLEPMPTMARIVGGLLALAAVGLFLLLAAGRRLSIAPPIAVLLAGLVASAIVSLLGSTGADYAWQRFELYLGLILLGTVVYLAYRDHGKLPLAAFFVGIAVVNLPFLMGAILWIKDSGAPFWRGGPRLAHFANVRQYAEFAFFAAVGASGAGLLERRLVLPSALLALAAVFGLVITGSRGALLAWIAFIVLASCFSNARLRAALHGSVVIAASTSVVWYLDRSGTLPSPNIFARIASVQQGVESFDSSRLALWRLSWHEVLRHPWFGSGPEGYLLSGCCDRTVMQAHNFVLQFLLEFGFVGCTILLVLLLFAVVRMGGLSALRQRILTSPENRVAVCLLAAFVAYSLIDQTMYHVVPLLLVTVFAGLWFAGLVQARAGSATHLSSTATSK